MKKNRMKAVLESIVQRDVPADENLWPRIAARVERKSLMTILRTRPIAVVIILLILLMLSGVAYALGRSLGYIPGFGLVDQNAQIPVLAEQVSQTRDGITITVEKVIVNGETAQLMFKVEGLTPDKFSFLEPLDSCTKQEELHFPNGEMIPSSSGTSSPLEKGTGFKSEYKYAPVPVGVENATLVIPCIHGALTPGVLPENWELPLHFVPAPPDAVLTMIPVIETTPSSEPQTTPSIVPVESTPVASADNQLVVTRFIDTGDSYILIGEFNPPSLSQAGEWRSEYLDMTLVDKNGMQIDWQIPSDIDLPASDDPHKRVWTIQFSKGFTPPVHITYTAHYVFPADSQETYTFEFDAGENPHLGQHWDVNQEFQLAGHTMRLTTIETDVTGYFFTFKTEDPNVNSLSVQIDGYTPNEQGGTSGINSWFVYVFYPEMPGGKLKVILSDLFLNGETKYWMLDWQP